MVAKIRKYFQDMSIRSKIQCYIMAFLITLMATLWIIQVLFFNPIYKIVKREEATEIAYLAKDVINGNQPAGRLVEEIADKEMCIVVFDGSLRQIQSLDGPMDCILHKMSYEEQVEIINNLTDTNNRFLEFAREDATYRMITGSGSRDFRLFNDENRIETFIYVSKIKDNLGEEYTIMVNAQAIPINSVINTMQTGLAIVSMFAITFAFMMLIFVSRIVSAPIEEINEKAKLFATGRYDVDFNAKGYKEINQLSNTMNYAAKELSNIESLRHEFISNVSHDLRTPLTMISGYAEVMRDIPGENSPENAQVIIDEANRLNNLVSDILNISKIQSGAVKPDLRRYGFTKSVQQLIKNVSELVKGEKFVISFEYDRFINITADENMLNRCIHNLISNAINYSGDSRQITVKQTVKDNVLKLEVIDKGLGIPAQILPYIWDRYYKNNDGGAKNIKSTGLGLSIVKTFVEAHGGSCGVESTEGHGSNFWFTINL